MGQEEQRKLHGGRRTTVRRTGDVQYDFVVKVVGAKFPAGYPMTQTYRYQVKWKRGDKLQGKTAHLPCDEGSVMWDYETKFTSTIQKKDAAKLHKKLMNFMLTEYRPREGGKHDKKSWEGTFNLASSVGIQNLGHSITDVTQDVSCGKGAGIELKLIISGYPRESIGGMDADLVTDIPVTDMGCLSNQDEAPTEVSVDDDEDLDDDEALPNPPPQHTTPPIGRPPIGAVVPMKEHLKLAEENKSLREEIDALTKDLAKTTQGAQRSLNDLQKCSQKLDGTREDCKKYLRYIDELEGSKREVPGAGPGVQSDVFLLGWLLVPSGVHVRAETMMKALARWGALTKLNNPQGEPNSFIINTLAVVEDVLSTLPEPTSVPCTTTAEWVNTIYNLLGCIAAEWPACKVAEKLSGCAESYQSGDFAAFLFSMLNTAPLLTSDEYPLQLVIDPLAHTVLDAGQVCRPDEAVDKNVVLSFSAHLLCSLRKCLLMLQEGSLIEVEANVDSILDCKVDGDAKIFNVVKGVHAVLTKVGCAEGLVACVVRQLFGHLDKVLFNALLRGDCYCTDENVLSYKAVIASFERWAREVKVQGKGLGCLPATRQACDLILLRGGTLDDPSLWSAISPEHFQVLLGNVPDKESIPPAILQQALSFDRLPTPRPLPVSKTHVLLPPITPSTINWQDTPIPAPLGNFSSLKGAPEPALPVSSDPSVLV
eukprot:TRINITY_DN21228_c0_g1_i1.p1 TRINITY_DN21228_c0_g1~~TRINITY_DN21228_c0_g1_i1.p1  ORF type:complete len:729 (+),score=206.37 TRINITY_DN21228_c0_g1_i1:65-2188(+)